MEAGSFRLGGGWYFKDPAAWRVIGKQQKADQKDEHDGTQ